MKDTKSNEKVEHLRDKSDNKENRYEQYIRILTYGISGEYDYEAVKYLKDEGYTDSPVIISKGRDSYGKVIKAYWLGPSSKGLDFIDELNERINSNNFKYKDSSKNMLDKSKVFIVHGHNNSIKSEMARLITNLGFEPIILHEQASSGQTIIEKIESYSNVVFAVVLYTPCDRGGKNESSIDLKPRARQNVVFEHGYLIAKIGRGKVCALVQGDVETPNDISGVVYIPIDSQGAWKYDLANEMSVAGYSIDKNKI